MPVLYLTCMFIVFGPPTSSTHKTVAQQPAVILKDLSGGWTLKFPMWPISTEGTNLHSWPEFSGLAITYFSGIATYSEAFSWGASDVAHDFSLDLGVVREIVATINGTKLHTILWVPHHRGSSGHLLLAGMRTVEIQITHFWPTRLIRDEPSGVTTRQTSTAVHAFSKNSTLLPPGLFGPV